MIGLQRGTIIYIYIYIDDETDKGTCAQSICFKAENGQAWDTLSRALLNIIIILTPIYNYLVFHFSLVRLC